MNRAHNIEKCSWEFKRMSCVKSGSPKNMSGSDLTQCTNKPPIISCPLSLSPSPALSLSLSAHLVRLTKLTMPMPLISCSRTSRRSSTIISRLLPFHYLRWPPWFLIAKKVSPTFLSQNMRGSNYTHTASRLLIMMRIRSRRMLASNQRQLCLASLSNRQGVSLLEHSASLNESTSWQLFGLTEPAE